MKTFIIAEAGVNHNGRLLAALQLVDAAKEAGADAVKFQMFSSQKLWGDDRIAELELTQTQFETIAEHCDKEEIEFMCTPFGVEEVQRCVDLGVQRIKIGSGSIDNGDLTAAAFQTGLPIIASTGMHDFEEVSRLAKSFKPYALLQCTSAYPCPLGDVNIRAMIALRRLCSVVGLSDHTNVKATSIAAVALGAGIIEKHLTLDASQDDGPDHYTSLEPDEFAWMVKGIRQVELALGDGVKRVMPSEQKLREVWHAKR